MSQHDMDLADAPGASFLVDVNAALVAQSSNQSGATAPGTTRPYMLWADTTTGLLKRRNAADNGWIVLATLAESFVIDRSSNTILGVADFGRTFRATAGFTQTLTAAATLGDGWWVGYRVESGATLVLDPNGAETIDLAATKTIVGPSSGFIYANAAAFYTIGFPSTSSSSAGKNYAVNGSFAANQIVTPTTTDNSYPIDGWRLLLGAANAATFVQDSADVPTGAGFAAKLVVGSGNNNKFGIFCPIENKDILDLRGGVASIRVALKATAGLTDGAGKIRIGIVQWTSTADAISATPVSAWGAEGTNPTLIANWAFANTPAALSVTTSWADYTVENISISASATNLGILIWSDDKANTQTTDILRVGGYVTLTAGASASAAMVAPFDQELRKAQRYFWKSFAYATAPAQNVGTNTGELMAVSVSAAFAGQMFPTVVMPVPMRTTPTITLYNPSAANSQVRDENVPGDCVSSTAFRISDASFTIRCTTSSGGLGSQLGVHATADARL